MTPTFFVFDQLGIILLSTLFLMFVVQLCFYFFYYRLPLSRALSQESTSSELPSVSIVIVATNESENLAQILPIILNQDYPNYEVVVVNDGSTDESEDLLKQYQQNHSHLYYTFSPVSRERAFGRRKLALTIGIKAAKNEILLFTEADCMPVSDQWISSMMSQMPDNKDVVLGYCSIGQNKGFFQAVAQFDNLLFSLQYLSMAIKNRPFTGIYRNVAFRKHLFFDNKGFSSCLNIENGEELFLNHVMTSENTTVALSQDSFVNSSLNSFQKWRSMKVSFLRIRKHLHGNAKHWFAIEVFSRYLFYLLVVSTILIGVMKHTMNTIVVAATIFMIRYIVQLIILNKARVYFCQTNKIYSFVLQDILQPVYNFCFSLLAGEYVSEKGKSKKLRIVHYSAQFISLLSRVRFKFFKR